MIDKYELYFSTPMSFSDLLKEFEKKGQPVNSYDITMDDEGEQKIELVWKTNGDPIIVHLEVEKTWGDKTMYELCSDSLVNFQIVHDLLLQMGVCMKKYEIHLKVDKNMTPNDIDEKIKSLGYRTVLDMNPKGLEWHIMGPNDSYMNVTMKLYKVEDGFKTYELYVSDKESFTKLNQILSVF